MPRIKRGMTAEGVASISQRQASTFPRRETRARVVHRGRPQRKRAQGRPGAGRTHGPPATKKAGGSHHRLGRTSGLPCAMVLPVSFVLSSGTGLSCPRRSRACQSLRAWPQRREAGTTRLRRPRRHRSSDDASRPSHPALHVRDDASAPLHEHGTATLNHVFPKNGSKIFFARGLDAGISVASRCEHGIFRARDFAGRDGRGERLSIEIRANRRRRGRITWRR
jgi:hypothetical protein